MLFSGSLGLVGLWEACCHDERTLRCATGRIRIVQEHHIGSRSKCPPTGKHLHVYYALQRVNVVILGSLSGTLQEALNLVTTLLHIPHSQELRCNKCLFYVYWDLW